VYANPVPGSGNVRIVVGQNGVGSGPNLWDFDTAGTLTLPGGSRLRPLGANLDIFAGTGSYVNLITSDESTSVGVDGGGGYIVTAGGTWDFDTTGNTSAPGNISAVGNITGAYILGNGSQLTDVSTSFDLEMHVSKDGNDSTGTGTILRPYLTITHALTQVTGGRNTVVVHPGGYTENPTIASEATQLITYDATGASTLVYGTVTIANTIGRIAGLKMTNLAITGNAQAYINSSTVDEQFTKSSSGYVEVDDCELQTTGNVLISGSGITTIVGNKIANLVVNNAGASVLVKGADDCVMPQVTAGSLNIVDSVIRASSNTANAVTASAGTVVTLMNNQIVTPAADNVARVSIAGYHSIISLVYDKANSTLSNSLNSVAYFQTANVDSLVSSGNITTAGNLIATGNIVLTGSLVGSGASPAPSLSGFSSISTTGATGNISASGNLLTAGYVSATGNVTTANSFVGNLVGTTVSVTGNISAGNIIVNGQPTTYGVANLTTGVVAIQATATGTVAATIISNTSPNLSSFSNGTSTSPATTVFTLSIPSAGTWQLESWIRTFSTTGTPLISGGFYTGGTLVANSETLLWPTPVTNANGAGYMSATVTTTGAATYTVGLWTSGTGVGLFSDSTGRTKAQATKLDSIFALNALDTMSLTGNITTSGNVSATGNVTAANFFGNGNTLSNVATQITGTWTVPVGNSTQSFTVSNIGTYSMWVDCNITNGILAWNATATVTNNNVPVVGAQYAWVYNGGGTPVDFTSIPNQFTGTANTIVRSSTAPSATTNRFDFGINNTSGGNVTVRYGYTKIS
jgi:hypothetical protein